MFAALLVAVFLVPALCRLLLHSSRWPLWRGLVVAGVAGIAGASGERSVLASVARRGLAASAVGDGAGRRTARRRCWPS